MPKEKQPRKEKNKAEVDALIKQQQNVERSKTLARMIFPATEQLETIYDAQTALNAAAGHLKLGLIKAEEKLSVKDLDIDLATGKQSDMKHVVKTIIELLANEPAKEAMELLDLMGAKLPEYLANKHLKDKRSTITTDEFIAK